MDLEAGGSSPLIHPIPTADFPSTCDETNGAETVRLTTVYAQCCVATSESVGHRRTPPDNVRILGLTLSPTEPICSTGPNSYGGRYVDPGRMVNAAEPIRDGSAVGYAWRHGAGVMAENCFAEMTEARAGARGPFTRSTGKLIAVAGQPIAEGS